MQIPGHRTGLTCRLAPFKGAASRAEVAREGGAHCCAGYLRGPEAGRVPHSVLTRADLIAGEITQETGWSGAWPLQAKRRRRGQVPGAPQSPSRPLRPQRAQ